MFSEGKRRSSSAPSQASDTRPARETSRRTGRPSNDGQDALTDAWSAYEAPRRTGRPGSDDRDDALTDSRAGHRKTRSHGRPVAEEDLKEAWAGLHKQLKRVWPALRVQLCQFTTPKKAISSYDGIRRLIAHETGVDPRTVLRTTPRDLANEADLTEALHGLMSYLQSLPAGLELGAAFTVQIAGGPGDGVDLFDTERVDPIDTFEIQRSSGVLIGDRGRVTVAHYCNVEQPIVDLAELTDLNLDTLGFAWWAKPAPDPVDGGVDTISTTVSTGLFFHVRHSDGLVVGDDNDVQVNVQHRVRGCRLSAVALLLDRQVRDALISYRLAADADDNSRQEDGQPGPSIVGEAHATLRESVAQAANKLCPDTLVSNLANDLPGQRPELRRNRHDIVISNVRGAAIGRGNTVSTDTEGQIRGTKVT